MGTPLTIALAQINPIVGNLSYNSDKILRIWRESEDKADLVVFPEMVLCGYPPEDLLLKKSFIEKIKKELDILVIKSKTIKSAALISCPWLIKGDLYNAVHLIHNGAILETRRKHHLPNYGVFDEKRLLKPGPMPTPVKFQEHSLGLMICEDMWFEDVASHLKDHGADILIVSNASPFEIGKQETRLRYAQDRVKETGLPLFYINQVGGQDDLVFDGNSFVLNEKGELVENLAAFKEDVVYRGQRSTRTPAAPEKDKNALLYAALKTGLRDYVEKNGFPGVLLGLSGGIDSALSACIAVDALGTDKVHAVMLPSKFTSQDSLDDARQQAETLGIKLDTIPIESAVENFHRLLSGHASPEDSPVTFENIQSRTRGVILMALSNAHGKMLLSTGNKSEMAVGYATLYGDMCGGFNALKDVYKTQVYALARWRNSQTPVIPDRVLTKAPTAELKDNQRDQDTLPPYDVLDAILSLAIEENKSPEDISEMGYESETVLRILSMLTTTEYKRYQAPPGVKITSCAFGRDRRYPMTNHFKG